MLNGNTKPIRIGNFNPFRDFGFAPTFVSAILDMVENCPAENFILSGGAYHSVREVISIFAVEAGFCPSFVGDGLEEKCIDSSSGEVLVNISPEFYRDVESIGQKGNSYKLENLLKRSIHYPFQKIASEMLKYDLSL
jgi:GDPmannose 4,6-dehydratase